MWNFTSHWCRLEGSWGTSCAFTAHVLTHRRHGNDFVSLPAWAPLGWIPTEGLVFSGRAVMTSLTAGSTVITWVSVQGIKAKLHSDENLQLAPMIWNENACWMHWLCMLVYLGWMWDALDQTHDWLVSENHAHPGWKSIQDKCNKSFECRKHILTLLKSYCMTS